jgi:hypothetical protein
MSGRINIKMSDESSRYASGLYKYGMHAQTLPATGCGLGYD